MLVSALEFCHAHVARCKQRARLRRPPHFVSSQSLTFVDLRFGGGMDTQFGNQQVMMNARIKCLAD